ncbi:TonB-dependent receptor plug domain-containing protein [Roseisolibacter agri]|uniref:TonB-dependent receptor n=1 Tax=Roseisolibacter agri TaxID=2014610 RepID=A0AA37Q293_9BACT|nr:TonB-dependent receptor [Roseisolibacter agri]GLC25265.1 TonB-dependent receptor [Roseisolibacter agri]
MRHSREHVYHARRARTAAIAALWVAAAATPAAAQHEHHGAPADSAKSLDAVTVRAKRVAVELRSGATIVDVRASTAAGGSIADLLRTVPGVELDADGRIAMRGSSSVLVLQNGRRIALAGDALAAFLRQMPASALERVEAGTTASARQGADGAAGVVNLIFRDDAVRRTGMRSLATSMATDDHYMGSAAASGDVGDVVGWDVTYALSGMRPRTDSKTSRWSLVPGDLPLRTEQDSRARERHRLQSVLAGAAVTPTDNASVALRGAYSWMEGASRSRSAFVYTNAAGNMGTSATGSLLEHVIPSGELSAVASVDMGAARLTSEARASFVDETLRGAYDDEDAGYRYMSTVMTARQRERVLRNDVGLRLSKIDLSVGQESRLRTVTAAHDATHFDATASQAYRHQLDVHAGYVTAQRSVGGVRAEAGLRVEAERTRLQLAAASARSAVRLFPSVSGTWTDARRALLYRLAYGRRIDRPGAEMLNPFSMGGDDANAIIGNPSLRPEVSDQVELGVERHRPRATLQLTPFLRWTRDPIRQLKAATARGGATTTLANLTRARAVGADGSVRARPTDRTVVTLAGSVAHMETAADAFGSSGAYATARLTIDVRVAASTTAQLYAYRRSAQAIEQGAILPTFTSELALTQRLAGDRGRVTLRLNDPLRSDRLDFRIVDAAFTQESRRRTARPLLSLFASYAVGGAPREEAPVRTERPARIF